MANKKKPTDEVVEEQSVETPQAEVPQAPVADPLLEQHVPVGSKAEAMREKLKAEPKVRVMIPLANGEKAGVTQSVILNGYSLYIRKGEYVEVPESVAEILDLKLKHKMSIEQHPARVKADGQVELQSYGS